MDLEMTGLDPDRCTIVEIATLITDDELEIVRTLVGSIGLVAAVPITTALAVFVVGQAHGLAATKTGGINDPREHRSRHERWMWGE